MERGWVNVLPQALRTFARKKEVTRRLTAAHYHSLIRSIQLEIEHLCERYYSGYLSSVEQLIRMGAERLGSLRSLDILQSSQRH